MFSKLEIKKIDSYSVFEEHSLEYFEKRYLDELTFANINAKKEHFNALGYCLNCKKNVLFNITRIDKNELIPNFRESIICPICRLNNRSRFMLAYLDELIDNDIKDIYLYEEVTSFFRTIKNKYSKINVQGSEYLGPNINSGTLINGIRHEDASNMSFDKDTFDVLISCDVLEHVPDYKKCLAESYRILKQNGKLLISIPFYYNQKDSIQRAELINGKLKYLKDEQYHGNPVSAKGSLVFWDYGWDFLDSIKEANFKDAYLLSYYSKECGHIGVFQHIIVAEK